MSDIHPIFREIVETRENELVFEGERKTELLEMLRHIIFNGSSRHWGFECFPFDKLEACNRIRGVRCRNSLPENLILGFAWFYE